MLWWAQGPYIKYDRNFLAFFDPLPPSDCKMTSSLLNSMTSLLLILTAIHQPPSPQVAVVLNVWPLTKMTLHKVASCHFIILSKIHAYGLKESEYWISEKNYGAEHYKRPRNPYILSTGFVSGALRNHNACDLQSFRYKSPVFKLIGTSQL